LVFDISLEILVVVKLQFATLRKTRWSEYATRFLIGAFVTVMAGLIAEKFGPSIGGLFLAFPAIFPASASLIQKHERQRKERAGMNGTDRGRVAAGIDAFGAALGSVGLVAFAITTWKMLPHFPLAFTLTGATFAWATTAALFWILRKRGRSLVPGLQTSKEEGKRT